MNNYPGAHDSSHIAETKTDRVIASETLRRVDISYSHCSPTESPGMTSLNTLTTIVSSNVTRVRGSLVLMRWSSPCRREPTLRPDQTHDSLILVTRPNPYRKDLHPVVRRNTRFPRVDEVVESVTKGPRLRPRGSITRVFPHNNGKITRTKRPQFHEPSTNSPMLTKWSGPNRRNDPT